MIVPALINIKITTTEVRTHAQVIALSASCELYYKEYKRWPTSLEEIKNNPKQLLIFEGDFYDGWRRPLIFRPYDSRLGYGSILSLGKDGKPGGKGSNADLEEKFEYKGSNANKTSDATSESAPDSASSSPQG